MVFSLYKKLSILYLELLGFKPPTIARLLKRRGWWQVGEELPSLSNDTGRQASLADDWEAVYRPSKITAEIKQNVEEHKRADNEMMAYQLHVLLKSKGYSLSLSTLLRCRTSLG